MNESSKERKERLSVATADAVEFQDLEWILCTCISLYPVKIFSRMTVWKTRLQAFLERADLSWETTLFSSGYVTLKVNTNESFTIKLRIHLI